MDFLNRRSFAPALGLSTHIIKHSSIQLSGKECTAMKVTSFVITLLISSGIAIRESQSTQAQRVVLDTPEVITLKLSPVTRRVSASVYQPLVGPFDPESKIRFAL